MNKPFYSNFKLGIIGGGQLGRMLIQEAIDFNLHTNVMDPDKEAPCHAIANEFKVGSLQSFDDVYSFGKGCDLVTFEFENINVTALKKLEKEGIPVYPQSSVLEIVQDKGLQKKFYKENNIPTADFILVENREAINEHKDFLPCFQKMRTSGYDGKGVKKLADTSAISEAFNEPSVLEKYIDFAKELSVIVARNVSGEIRCFPVVECEFSKEANLVEFLFSPAEITESQAKEAESIAIQVAEKLQIVGILAVEMFLTKEGKILVNEIAPRPHNSGHQTIEGNITSQYQQHLRAILDMPLGDPDMTLPSVMVNVLGEKGFEGVAKYEGLNDILKISGVNVHLYGKVYTKSFRKMGHVTVIDKDLNSAKAKAQKVKDILKVKSF